MGRRGGRGPARGGVAAQFGGRVCRAVAADPGGWAAPSFSLPSSTPTACCTRSKAKASNVFRLPLRCAGRWHASPRPVSGGYGSWPTTTSCCPGPTLRLLRERFPAADVVSGWGMTETGGAGLVVQMSSGADRTESPHGGMEFAVAGSVDGIGELWCRGPSVMRGYWGDPAATARTIAGGWLHTGDVVRMGRGGEVRLVGRAADAVEIPRGVVYSREMEAVLLDFPGIEEAVVVGVSTPRGTDLAVAVVPAPGVALDLDAVREYLDGPSGTVCRLGCVRVCGTCPRGSTGRVDRPSVRAWWRIRVPRRRENADVG